QLVHELHPTWRLMVMPSVTVRCHAITNLLKLSSRKPICKLRVPINSSTQILCRPPELPVVTGSVKRPGDGGIIGRFKHRESIPVEANTRRVTRSGQMAVPDTAWAVIIVCPNRETPLTAAHEVGMVIRHPQVVNGHFVGKLHNLVQDHQAVVVRPQPIAG